MAAAAIILDYTIINEIFDLARLLEDSWGLNSISRLYFVLIFA